MKLFRSETKKKRIKNAMLKEIYKDNLKISGQAEYPEKKPKWPIVRNLMAIGLLPLLAILVYILLNNFYFLGHTHSQAKPNNASTLANSTREEVSGFIEPAGYGVNPSQYQAFLSESQVPLRKIFGLKVKKIVIDPGHGGEDRGAVGILGTKEKDLTLDIAKKLRAKLDKHRKYQVLMTRETDITLSLEERVKFANSSGADLFISIHVNSIPKKPLNIIETFYFGPHTDQDALLLAEKENEGTGYTMKDFREIIRNIGNTLKTQESNSLALHIQKSLYRNISKLNNSSRNWGIKTAPFVVLLGVNVPCVLAEVTCLSHRGEERKLRKEYYRDKIADYLEEGIVSYLNK
ncbi:MAG: N-acetylmuramoyl-L-alanine amidase [Candidatus Aminicenantes bacterium]|nr:N-acetylmuramoyl-L-alanine amidase [Candidatus Aminicenantes bacterium]